jgi:hypothetical protein
VRGEREEENPFENKNKKHEEADLEGTKKQETE